MKNYTNIDTINTQYRSDPQDAVRTADAIFQQQLAETAEKIHAGVRQCPIILIAGPSGSGKTTTAKKLEEIFDSSGLETHTIPLDNYFRSIPKEDYIHIKSGKLDLESPERLNTELLSEHLRKLIACEPVTLPYYDFATTTSRCSGITLQRKPEEPIILEGIHALNPDVIQIPENQRFAIYVSVQTHISCGDTTMHPLYLRLMRRMMRDKKYRGRTPLETLEMLSEVERGKLRFIKPFRRYATHEIDTFFSYEPGVYRNVLLPELEQAPPCEEITLLCKLLRAAEPVEESRISQTALIREFLGGSIYHEK
ncbi:MAG: ATP/GTP-binding protein [Ruminococcus sp.]|nr:ATP/GTP-binding protein [Ruminococcus sp.]